MLPAFVGLKDGQSISQQRLWRFIPPPGEPPATDDAHWPSASARSDPQQPFYSADRPFYYTVKRLVDLLLMGCALGFLVPLLLIIVIAIKVDSPGPLIVSAERIGLRRQRRNGKVQWLPTAFALYRFRTTTSDHSLTRVGRYLRQSNLEQLPQVWNIIKGDLTLVGPRPLLPSATGWRVTGAQRQLTTLPGMIGLWQVSEGNRTNDEDAQKSASETACNEMTWLDDEYSAKQSLRLDALIVCRTLQLICNDIARKCTKSK